MRAEVREAAKAGSECAARCGYWQMQGPPPGMRVCCEHSSYITPSGEHDEVELKAFAWGYKESRDILRVGRKLCCNWN